METKDEKIGRLLKESWIQSGVAEAYCGQLYMTFHELEGRLRARLNQKVRRGEISERQLARITGYTQPHIHNVLKGLRGVNADLADAVLASVALTVDDLLREDAATPVVGVPVWRGLVGAGHRFPRGEDPVDHRPFPADFVARFAEPALLCVAPEANGMSPLIDPGDLILIDRDEKVRRHPSFESIYAVSFADQGAVCRCQVVGSALVLVTENPHPSSPLPEYLPLGCRDIIEIVRGKVAWACRERDLL